MANSTNEYTIRYKIGPPYLSIVEIEDVVITFPSHKREKRLTETNEARI